MEHELILLKQLNKISGICANPTKSLYCLIDCSYPLDVIVNKVVILPANKRPKQRQHRSFFSPKLRICNLTHQATAILEKSLLILNNKMNGLQS
jgi:hypothetical protein